MPDKTSVLTAKQLAALVGVTVQRISQLTSDGTLHSVKGGYDHDASLQAAFTYFRSKADLSVLRREKLQRETELLDIALAKARRETIPLADAERAWANLILLCRGKLLRLPAKVSPRLVFCKSEVEMRGELEREIDEALLELSKPIDHGAVNP